MKPESIFVLENAGWPSFLVEEGGTIRRTNQAAVQVFGSVVEGEAPLLSAVWGAENDSSADQFVARVQRAQVTGTPIKFRIKGGATTVFHTYVCPVNRDGQKYLIFQMLREPARTHESPKTEAHPAAGAKADGATLDANVAHKQKLDCALQLARSIALDFNNALTSILGHTSLLLEKLGPNDKSRSSLVEIEKSAAKAAEIASDLAAFSRQEKDNRVQMAGNLNVLLQRTVELFRTPAMAAVNWSMQLERKLFTVKFDEAKMQQAFMKVFENGVHAIEPDGRMAVSTRNMELSQPTQDRTVKLAAGNYVCIEISDNGPGIDPEVLPRIFEPFFTTKGSPHRGLGLAWVYGIVTNHGGGVAVSSQPGVGTSVRIYLPANKKIVKESAPKPGDLRGSQRVLIVDDEDLLLTMGQMILSSFGYEVITANSGQKALEIFSQSKKPIDLMVTDLVMPNMSGRELIEHVRRISPDTGIICSSGYVRAANLDENEIYLQKPFTSQELLLKVKHALASEAA